MSSDTIEDLITAKWFGIEKWHWYDITLVPLYVFLTLVDKLSNYVLKRII